MNYKLLFVGCGKMGGALLGGFLKNGLKKENTSIIEPSNSSFLKEEFGVNAVSSLNEIEENYTPDIILFAVKPQMLNEVLPSYKKWGNNPNILALSVAAGADVSLYRKHLGQETPIIRLMPNLPAFVGEGMTGAYASKNVSDAQKQITSQLVESVGKVVWIEDEEQMHAITAISGSGPAYLFHFVEAMENAAKELGLPDDIAKTLAYQTVCGSAKMVAESEKTATDLRIQVTSPNGTTAAALDVLMNESMQSELIKKATKAAFNRSIEL